MSVYPACTCVDVAMGSYTAAILLTPPVAMQRSRTRVGRSPLVSIDPCILPEVTCLWALGIRTIESCCGHKKAPAYIAVVPEDQEAMLDIGYSREVDHPHVFVARGIDHQTGKLLMPMMEVPRG